MKKLFLLILIFVVILILSSFSIFPKSKTKPALAQTCAVNSDIVIVIDRSGSMSEISTSGNRKLTDAKTAARSFVNKFAAGGSGNRIAVASFASTGTRDASLMDPSVGNNDAILKNTINSFSSDGDTCAECGIARANAEIRQNGRTGTKKVVIFLTDGIANVIQGSTALVGQNLAENRALNDAQSGYDYQKALDGKGTNFYTIGLGSGSQINPTFLREIAWIDGRYSGGYYRETPNSGELTAIYNEIADDIVKCPPPTPIPPTSTPTPTTPPSTHSISGGVFIDDDGDGAQESSDGNGQKDAGENFYSGTINLTITGGPTNIDKIIPSGPSGFTEANLASGTYTVSFPVANIPAGYNLTYPPNTLPPPKATVTVGTTTCSTGGAAGHLYASCSSGNVTGLTFGLNPPQQEKWIQSVGGDIRYDRPNWVNYVPPGSANICPSNPTTPYVSSSSLSGPSLSGGTVFTGLNPVFTTDGSSPRSKSTAPPNQRLIRDNKFTPGRGTIKTSYAYVRSAIDRTRPPTSGIFGGIACNESLGPICNLRPGLAVGNYVGAANERVILRNSSNTYTFGAGDYLFLIDGDLWIETNLIVPRGSSVIFVVKGELHVGGGVSRIEGIFSTDRTFIIRNNPSPTPLIVEGNIIANAGISSGTFTNERDLAAQNAQCPAVRIINRPDFILNGPAIIRYSNYIVEEVAPRGNLPN